MTASILVPISRLTYLFAAAALLLPAQVSTTPCIRGTFRDYHNQPKNRQPPRDWTGPVFKLSQQYPDVLPAMGDYPWLDKSIRVENGQIKNPAAYLEAVKRYVLAGNTASSEIVNFGDNKVRPWFHIPWMDYEPTGREFTHGLTHEIDSRPGFLDVNQTGISSTWAVSGINDRGGWAIGQVWCRPEKASDTDPYPDAYMLNPDEERPNSFPNGTAEVKFLFTTGGPDQIPWLKNTLEWQADINQLAPHPKDKPFEPCDGDGKGCRRGESCNIGVCFTGRKPGKVYLMQVDVAVRDDRTVTGWAFGTFAYNARSSGATVFDRLVPIGLMWGNDPGITELAVKRHDATIKESWINPAADPVNPDGTPKPNGMFGVGNHLGYAGRLNGPADQATSSCLSCHMTSGLRKPKEGSIVPDSVPIVWQGYDANMKQEQQLNWFINLPAGVTFSYDSYVSLDYQLQLGMGIRSFFESRAKNSKEKTHEFTTARDVVPATLKKKGK